MSTQTLQHLALILDGNRRWARKRGLYPWEGHKQAAEKIEDILKACRDENIKYVTLWVFSTENWKRPREEKTMLFKLLRNKLKDIKKMCMEHSRCFTHLGRKDRIPNDLAQALTELENTTSHFTDWNIQLALDYGGRDEIVRAVRKIGKDIQNKKIRVSDITEEMFQKYLDTYDIPDPDLIIRTGNRNRLSGYLPFQSTYSEFIFMKKMFPDFTPEDLHNAVKEYYRRRRTFGK